MIQRVKHKKNTGLRGLLAVFAVAVAALTMGSCTKDPEQGRVPLPGQPGVATMAFTVEGIQTNSAAVAVSSAAGADAQTRATAVEGHEARLKDVHILFYTAEGAYVDYEHASVSAGTSSFPFALPEDLEANTAYKTLIVGNAHTYVPTGDGTPFKTFDDYLRANTAKTYDQMRQAIMAQGNPTFDVVTNGISGVDGANGGLPMYGRLIDGSGAETDFIFPNKEKPEIKASILFTRSVCRLDLSNLAAAQLDIEFVKVCNYRNGGYYFHNDAPWGNIFAGLTGSTPENGKDGWVSVADPADGRQSVTAKLYAFPNIVPVTAQNDKLTTYLMIAGKYKGTVDGKPAPDKITYYRFNMATLGSSQVLKRNFAYKATINRVTGPGDDSEEEASNSENPKLDYTVDDEWEDDNSTVTDGDGNYLTVSRTQVTFDGKSGMTEVVSVKVKEGLSWTVDKDNITGDTPDAFNLQRINNTSFSITTSGDNATQFVKNGHLRVSVPGKPLLSLSISLVQLSSLDEVKTLLVDGRTGTLEYRIPGEGGSLTLMVQTGSVYAGWFTDGTNTLESWGGTCTKSGANKGYLNITLPTNVSSGERTATVTVKRDVSATADGSEGTVPDVTINITQPKSNYIVSISPRPENNTLVVDAFSGAVGTPNGFSVQKKFQVYLTDVLRYTWKATSTLFKDYDACLSLNTALAATTQANFVDNTALTNAVAGENGEAFWLNIFRTGPGDPDINGTVTITATPRAEYASLPEMSISFAVTIRSNCEIDNVVLDNLVIADRNVGAVDRMNQAGDLVRALNFTNDVNVKITAGNVSGDPDNMHKDFKGDYYTFNIASPATFCPAEYADKNVDDDCKLSPWYKSADREKWYTPSQTDLQAVAGRMCFSKQRAFLVSDQKNDKTGKSVGCFFPLSGFEGHESYVEGWYYGSEQLGEYGASLTCYAGRALTMQPARSALSVRCVRARE